VNDAAAIGPPCCWIYSQTCSREGLTPALRDTPGCTGPGAARWTATRGYLRTMRRGYVRTALSQSATPLNETKL
jgi:hypothetical protein